MSHLEDFKSKTIKDIIKKKQKGEKIAMLTCYDYSTAKILNETDIDILLIGDSLGNVFAGYRNTLPVKLEDIIYHTNAVLRGAYKPLIVADMPFLSFQISPEDCLFNAGTMMKECHNLSGVKLEGGVEYAHYVEKLTSAGIPVMGHIGLRPQVVNQLGGYKVIGKTREGIDALIEDAKALEEAGAFAVVLELVPKDAAREVSEAVSIPTIGIGAGNGCDGQVLVINDMLGMAKEDFKHNRKYLNLYEDIKKAAASYIEDVKSGDFPNDKESF
jgi:3-methyl-2-oxobutanoate hydroxymethyltransferase